MVQTHAYYHIIESAPIYQNAPRSRVGSLSMYVRCVYAPHALYTHHSIQHTCRHTAYALSNFHIFACSLHQNFHQVTRHGRKLQEICKFRKIFTTFMRCRSLMLTFFRCSLLLLCRCFCWWNCCCEQQTQNINWGKIERNICFLKLFTTRLSLNIVYL